ncbi:c-type cytochrome [Roseospirillum parvum]|uniref:Cytochrome c556 n=1 Tax=Roseospirillum parvum TaxID=83401 RepID=A0A1G7WTJ4_9PROT|nr:cytochrome c [Roseospirillum parvum]SDG75216.1 Cytochrome c556 [Roseospirillum parvum]
MKRIVLTAATAALLAGATPAFAADADAVVEHRKDVMGVAGAGMGAIGCFMKGDCELDGKVLAHLAEAIAFSAEMSIPAFKDPAQGASVKHTSDPAIWENWDKFEGGLKKMAEAADKLAVAAKDADRKAMGPLVKDLGGTCKGCHDDFRTK